MFRHSSSLSHCANLFSTSTHTSITDLVLWLILVRNSLDVATYGGSLAAIPAVGIALPVLGVATAFLPMAADQRLAAPPLSRPCRRDYHVFSGVGHCRQGCSLRWM